VCAVPTIILQRKIQTNVESFTLTAKLNAISENLSVLLRACVQNEVNGIHKFYRRKTFFTGTFYVSFSYELCTRKSLDWFKLQGSEKPEVTLLFAFDRCEAIQWINDIKTRYAIHWIVIYPVDRVLWTTGARGKQDNWNKTNGKIRDTRANALFG